MKSPINVDFLKTTNALKIVVFFFITFTFFYLGKHWSDGYQQLIFFTQNSDPDPNQNPNSAVSISPNFNKNFNISTLIDQEKTLTQPPPPSPPPPSPPPSDSVEKFGIVNENGTMSEEFEIGSFDPAMVDDWVNETQVEKEGSESVTKFAIKKFGLCSRGMSEYIPCLDNVEAIKKLPSTEKGERFERHCPEDGKKLNCLVPAPKGYRAPIPWPKSRDEVWFSNVPHTRLVEDKGGQNWISRDKDKFKFPGGGTQFIHGADEYLDHISKMIPEITFGRHIRVALDVGCGVASFGAYLLQRNVITMSVAPKDVHENQIQFALERGVPAMVAAFATRRLLYPSQAFDLIHCSRCRINWTRDDGILLLEVNRMLRAGGYFVWAAQPVYKHEEALEEQWEEMLNLTTRLCWKFLKKDGYIAVWQKPFDNSCYLNREAGTKPPLCDPSDDPDNVWYVDLKACISELPKNEYEANITDWPARLQTPPNRLQSIKVDAFISRKELFKAESKYWNEIIEAYVRALHWKKIRLRNVMDMRAGFGGFAAAMITQKLDSWVMNVVPVSGPNTLPVIYDRGLIGVMHDWCEPFDTYPRTYDFLHAAYLLSVERKRCNVSSIMVEMDRILRPGGRVYIRDSLAIMDELQEIAKAIGWHASLRDTAEGPHASYRVLVCDKHLLRA
ncbi:putative S-adenosyl-L-methionine-dependent methyltransferase [Medicago truncatula]|uniref:Methyltransferase n=1 Tax=Medicago truncatula TaxID=3880 RepID=G7J9Y1_MEDTR|nr:probable methyltransferase PMT11 [Medicago truncatula]AES71005.2 methyltransferase PMT16, putative [Medicago truncatula]RHN68294.1 putative S-adenosyl-L-methionine-dependent methyltransferase [Medicago truncatula]